MQRQNQHQALYQSGERKNSRIDLHLQYIQAVGVKGQSENSSFDIECW